MNNLLRTLTESQVKPAADLRLLLTTVKEGRRQSQDAKLTDPFYDSLEGLLTDLKTISIDNRDAEAFLKPVSRAEVPDYYDVIQHPMDFQTMLKKVKQKQYKSKREFKDDLDLIWSNCLTYNANENHPLRPCVFRLQVKAERLLKHITDRKERADPSIPSDLPSPIGGVRPRMNGTSTSTNGYLNGHSHSRSSHSRSSSLSKGSTPRASTSITIPPRARTGKDVPFADAPAIVRTPEGMGLFAEWDREVDRMLTDVVQSQAQAKTETRTQEESKSANALVKSLRELAPVVEVESEEEAEKEDSMIVDSAGVGDKRKLNGTTYRRPRKKVRYTTQYPTPLADEKDDLTQLWWGAVQSDPLVGNGLPGIPFGPSSSHPTRLKKKDPTKSHVKGKTKGNKPYSQTQAQGQSQSQSQLPKNETPNPKSLLTMMNSNIKTMRRLRHTHSKFAALNAASAPPEDQDGDQAGEAGLFGSSSSGAAAAAAGGVMHGRAGGAFADVDVDEEVNDKIDESPWTIGRGKGKGKGKRKEKEKERGKEGLGGIELGVENASDCLHWTTNKILEHAGFQGTSTVALDVLADVAAEYLQNVGRTIKYLTDKFGRSMTPEEIILHTLFESGSSKVQDLERYISDDIERYGSRLGEVEKKLASAYRETTAGEILEDEGLFEEDPEEPGLLAMGDFADMLGEDYLGLRELGIAEEFGLSNLSIPKKLLRGKKAADRPTAAKPTEPPPPYPPPPPFVPLTADKVDDQIGLLKPYYQSRFTRLATSMAPPPLPPSAAAAAPPPGPGPGPGSGTLPTNTLPNVGPSHASRLPSQQQQQQQRHPSQAQAQPEQQVLVVPPDLALPDELPDSTHMKIGPIGQILKTGAGASAAKKKAKGGVEGGAGGGAGVGGGGAGGTGHSAAGGSGAGGAGAGAGAGGSGLPPGGALANATAGAGATGGGGGGGGDGSLAVKKKKGNLGVGTGNGRKKNVNMKDGSAGPPPGPGMSGYGAHGQGQQGGSAPVLPAVVFASA